MIRLLCFVLAVLAASIKSKVRLEAENAVLRHQLTVLRRRLQTRVRLTNNDRRYLIVVYRWFPSILQVLTIIRPETLIADPLAPLWLSLLLARHRWHRPQRARVDQRHKDSDGGMGCTSGHGGPWDGAPGYMIRDRDRIYGDIVTRRLRAMGIRDSLPHRFHLGRTDLPSG